MDLCIAVRVDFHIYDKVIYYHNDIRLQRVALTIGFVRIIFPLAAKIYSELLLIWNINN